ncbi:MAG TPA: PDZ domain-containing protein [Thermoanaerobaculia bacterium]
MKGHTSRKLTLLFLALIAGLVHQNAEAQETRLLRFPAIHGDTVVFTYASDLWVADRKGGQVRRLTAHSGNETRARISPDGTLVAFLAAYDGNPDVYVMPIAGGAPKRLTWDPMAEGVAGWTPDGKIAYASIAGSFTNRQDRLWLVDPDGGLPRETPLIEFANGSFFPGGKRVAYNRTSNYTRNWRRYRGGSAGRISIYDFAANAWSELPGGRENSWFPMVAGNAIYYVSDRDGTVNLYRHDLATGRDEQLTRHDEADIRWPSSDGKSIIYEHDGYLRVYDIATGSDEKLRLEVKTDEISTRPYLLKMGKRLSGLSLSPNGARVAVEARGEIFSVAVKGKDARNLTSTPGVRETTPRWSPDGKTIYYLSDASGEFQIYARPATGGPARRLSEHTGSGLTGFTVAPDGKRLAYWTEEMRVMLLDPETRQARQVYKLEYDGATSFDWSPDGKWIAYSAPGRNLFGAIHLYEVATGKTTRVTEGFYDDRNPKFDLSGKYLYFTSARAFTPSQGRFEASLKVENADRIYLLPLTKDLRNPLFPDTEEEKDIKDAEDGKDKKDKEEDKDVRVRIDLEGLAGRAVALPLPPSYPGLLFGAREGVYHYTRGKLRKFDLSSKETVGIFEGPPPIQIEFSPDGTRFAYLQEETLGVVEAKPDVKPGAGKVDTDAVEVWVDPRAEWRQMFWENWRFQRDNFFRADMWGLDWQAVGKRYEQFLPHVSNWADMKHVLGLLLGELGTSHAYIDDPPQEPAAADRVASAAMLGADYEPDGRWVRFQRIYPGTLTQDSWRGPLGEPGVNIQKGDYLLEIDGVPVEASVHPNALLINKADRVVTLTVNSRPALEGARKVQVRPIANEVDLRYYEWVEENRRKVDRLSGGRIGYIHYPNTAEGGQTAFIRGYWAQTDKDAVILDERFNGGGFPQPMVLPTLARRSQTVVLHRKWDGGSEVQAINGPKAMLINGYAGSGGDLTPWMFRDAGMGTLIGTRTMGALVGIAEARELINGGVVTAPGYTRFDPKTGDWIAENTGIEPDIEVDARPDLVAQGRDPQLEKAVEHLMEELKRNPPSVATPKLPPPPRPTSGTP